MSTYTQQELLQALERCASEPIHQIGMIQPHGVMIVTEPGPELRVLQTSANLVNFLGLTDGVSGASLLGKPLSALLGEGPAIVVHSLIARSEGRYVANGSVQVRSRGKNLALQARVFPAGDHYALELIPEVASESKETAAATIISTQRALLRIEEEHDPVRYMEHIADLTRDISGFDRVMIYRFDSNWDGEVIAESRAENVLSYLGTRFPASDIPPQARQLYTQNRFRLVADVEADPVPLVPTRNPVTGQPLDLTLSVLRSFSPVHVEYLRNMGVKASMSISLLQNGRLWGLVACHHMSPRSLSATMQDTAARISQIASARLSALEAEQRQNLGGEVSAIVGLLLQYINVDSEQAVLELMKTQLLRLFDASGLIVVIEAKVYTLGETPDAAAVQALLAWLGTLPASEAIAYDDLSQHHPAAEAYVGIASGILASPISAEMRNCMIWLRPERLRTVRWAGSPVKTIQTDAAGLVHLSPRKSFEDWSESWRARSASWAVPTVEAAAILARALTEGIAQKSRLEQVRAAQREIEHRYSLALQATNDGIWDWNITTGTTYINPAFSEMLGYTPGDIGEQFDQLWPRLLHPDERDSVLAAMDRRQREEGHFEMEFRLRCKDDSYKWILSRGTVLERDEVGLPTRAIGTHIDLTMRKEMELALREAKDYAEAANRAKSQFLANMSHELRTPLNVIIGMTDLARPRVADPKAHYQLGKALQSASELLRLINDILDISRIESERLTLERVAFTLDQALADIGAETQRKAEAKGLAFTLTVAERITGRFFMGDPQRIGQIIRNLVSNAVKFTEQGWVALRVSEAEDYVTGLIVRFEIEDTGIGIPPEHQARLFSLFEQGDGSSTRKYGGTGLGLVLAQRLVDLMGGQIGVSSEVGRGSLFWFTVPLGVANQGDLTPPVGSDVPQISSQSALGNDHVNDHVTERVSDHVSDHVTERVSDLASEPVAPVLPAGFDRQALREVCLALLPMVVASDLQAQEYVDANSEFLRSTALSEFQQIQLALRQFDYDLAEQLIRNILNQHGVEP